MKTRRLQKTGGSSYSITIPKKWIDQLRLKDKSLLEVNDINPKILKLYPAKKNNQILIATIDAQFLSTIEIIREVIASYLSGFDQVIIKKLTIKQTQNAKLRNLFSTLIGFEIIEEATDKIILQNIFDSNKFPISTNVDRMFTMVKSIFTDTILALENQDITLSRSILKRETEIDKFHLAVTRQFYVHLRNDLLPNQTNLNSIDLYYYGLISRQLERIADHCVKICLLIENQKYQLKVINPLIELSQEISHLLDKSQVMVKIFDKKMSHQIINQSLLTSKQIDQIQMKLVKPHLIYNTACDSLDRICGYLKNMAEATIDQSVFNQ